MNRRNVLKAVGGAGILLTTGVGTAAARNGRRQGASGDQTIADIVTTTDDFSSLAAALDATGLVGVFEGNRQYTVFAPDNEAFGDLLDALGLDDLGELIDVLGVDGVRNVLLYHVTNGRRYSESVVDADEIKMENGEVVEVDGTDLNGGGGVLGGATIEAPDTEASNGVVHRINGVLLPPE